MARNVKCQFCTITDTPKDEMEFELVGKAKPVKKYYHKHCYPDFLKDKEFKAKEREKKDKLVETIKKIYGISPTRQLPRQVFPMLESLRNGQEVFGNQSTGKRYKQGYEYDLIEKTYEYCEYTIQDSLKNISSDGFMGVFRYGLAIVIDKIYFVEQREVEKESKKRMVERHIENVTEEDTIFESNYKKKSSKTQDDDILDFLDD